MARIAVNCLGRMGKILLRRLFDDKRVSELVLLNEPCADIEQHALLLEFDTVHGRWDHDIEARGDQLSVSGHAMRCTQVKEIRDLPLQNYSIDLAVDCTGDHNSAAKLHSQLVFAFAKSERVAKDVGFYCMSNAVGRLVGTLLSGLCRQLWGVAGCLTTAAIMSALSFLAAGRLARRISIRAQADIHDQH